MAPRRSALLRLRDRALRRAHRLAAADARRRRPRSTASLAGRERGRAARACCREGFGMRTALLNPRWSYEGSIYFGSRDPHLPLEHGYAKALLQARGHATLLIDAHLMNLSPEGG